MSKENRFSNTEMVSVPRHTLENILNDGSCKTEVHAAFIRARNDIERLLTQPAEQHQRRQAVLIPDGYCLMPRQLTAENGAKALLLGEFKLEVTHECPECIELDEPAEGCEICDGQGEYAQRHTIPWDQIKFIYSEAVKGLALKS